MLSRFSSIQFSSCTPVITATLWPGNNMKALQRGMDKKDTCACVNVGGFPGGSVAKNLPVWSLVWEDPLEKEMAMEGNGFLLSGKSHRQRSLVGYSTWGHKRDRYNLVTKQQYICMYACVCMCMRVYTCVFVYINTHSGILLSHKKEWNNAICSNMGRPGDDHTKWGKPDKDKYRVISFTSVI